MKSSAFLSISVSIANAEVLTSEVKYTSGDKNLVGYIAYDDVDSHKRPGILIVHEWWGLNEYVRRRARMLAEEGYTAFAMDIYGEGG